MRRSHMSIFFPWCATPRCIAISFKTLRVHAWAMSCAEDHFGASSASSRIMSSAVPAPAPASAASSPTTAPTTAPPVTISTASSACVSTSIGLAGGGALGDGGGDDFSASGASMDVGGGEFSGSSWVSGRMVVVGFERAALRCARTSRTRVGSSDRFMIPL